MGEVISLGIRVKTARAIVVVLGGAPLSPEILDRRELAIWDPEVPESHQPYHAGLEVPEPESMRIVSTACKAVERSARLAFGSLCAELQRRDLEIGSVALVMASDTDPDTIHNPHMRAHALEGRLFPHAMRKAAHARRQPCTMHLERRVFEEASSAIGLPESELKERIAQLGKSIGAPWRIDQKSACAAAWLALASPHSG
jgi:hypothetical protein